MLYYLAIVMFFFGILLKKNKIISIGFFVYLWILFGWSYGNADYVVHLRRFNDYRELGSQTEFLYEKLMQLFNFLGFSYQGFLILFSLLILCSYFLFAKRNTKEINFVFAFYLVFPFCMDVTMFRYTLAFSIVLFGIDALLRQPEHFKLIFITSIVIASMIHLAAFFAIFLIIPFVVKQKYFYIGTALILLIGIVAHNFVVRISTMASNISFLHIGTKISIALAAAGDTYTSATFHNYVEKIIISFVIFMLISNLILYWTRQLEPFNSEAIIKIKIMIQLNVASLLIIPLLTLNADLFRLQLSLIFPNIVAFSQFYRISNLNRPSRENNKIMISLRSVILILLTTAYVVINLYSWVLRSANLNVVLRPLFEHNLLVN